MSHLRELKLEVECDECARKDRVIRQYAENHSKLVEEVSAAQEVARAAGKEVTKLKGKLTKEHNESVLAEKIEQVVAHWRSYRPKASKAFGKPGSKSFTIIEKALVLMDLWEAQDPIMQAELTKCLNDTGRSLPSSPLCGLFTSPTSPWIKPLVDWTNHVSYVKADGTAAASP